MKNKLFLILAVLLLLVYRAEAIGITPGRTTFNFEPNLRKTVQFSVINSEHKDMGVLITVRGDLKQYITLNEAYSEFTSKEESKSFSYEISLPDKFDNPGLYEGEIVAVEVPNNFSEKGTFVWVSLAVISQLHVYVPYPGKFLEASVDIVPGEEIVFFVPVVSRGKLDIVSAKGVIDIYSGDKRVKTLETQETEVKSLERKELFVRWKPDIAPGTYKAKASVFYDNQVAYAEKEFNVGELALSLLDVYVKDFQLGGIAKFNALVENKWSQELKDAFLEVLVYNNEDEVMADFKSQTYNIPALSKAEMVAFWDTAGVKAGMYDGKVILNFGKMIERPVKLQITQDEIIVVGATGRVITKEKGKFSTQNLLIGAVIVLIGVNIVWFVIIRRLTRKKEAKKQRGVEKVK